MPQNAIRTAPQTQIKKVYSLLDAKKIITEDDVLALPFDIFYEDTDAMQVITYQLRKVGLKYWIDRANLCIRR